MKKEKNKTKNDDKSPNRKAWEEKLCEIVYAVSLVKASETHWDNKELILSFETQEDMLPFVHFIDCVFATIKSNAERGERRNSPSSFRNNRIKKWK